MVGLVLALAAATALSASVSRLGSAEAPDGEVPSPWITPGPLPLDEILGRLPGRNWGRHSRPGDALNLVFVGDEGQVLSALESSGWARVPHSIAVSLVEGVKELAAGRWPAKFPPMNRYSLFGKIQDHNFSIPTAFPYSRHHFRLWRSPFKDGDGRTVWWGSGDFDLAIRWSDLSHVPDPEMDREREFIASTLKGRARMRWVPLPQIPREGKNDKGYPFRTDGRALLAEFSL